MISWICGERILAAEEASRKMTRREATPILLVSFVLRLHTEGRQENLSSPKLAVAMQLLGHADLIYYPFHILIPTNYRFF
jgi:hypothetical protein